MSNGYYTPWLWVDGHERGYDYGAWGNYVAQALTLPADVQVNLSGSYDPGTRSGQVQAELVSSSAGAINANVYVVVTEDSCYYVGPNGDPWHNHVCRDFIPDQNGTPLTLPALGRETLVTDFTLDLAWNETRCNIVVFYQDPVVQPDSTKPVYNGAQSSVGLFTSVAEPGRTFQAARLAVVPSLVSRAAEFQLRAAPGLRYRLAVYRPDGSRVRELVGTGQPDMTRIVWNRNDGLGRSVPPGVYAYHLTCGRERFSGKLVVTE